MKHINLIGIGLVFALFMAVGTPALAGPPTGWLHLDAKAGCVVGSASHHYITNVTDDVLLAQLYESESEDARPVAIEYIVTKKAYDKLPQKIKKLYHIHKPEVDRGEISLPGMPPEDAKKTLEFVASTYGRVLLLKDISVHGKIGKR